jgi:SAM-dependent methyltransferase
MLDYARSRQPAEDRVVWHQADAMALPFQDATFDLACCQFGAMFFPDRPAAYREARRVVRPNGRLLFSVWDRIETNVFADDVTKALATVFPDDPPRFAERTPHGYYDRNQIRDDLARAGFREIEIDTRADVSRAPSAHAVAVAYCQGTPLRGEIEARDPTKLEAATKAVEAALMAKHGNGEIAAKIQAHVISASG